MPIAAALVFDRTLDCDRLATSLATVLRDYPIFAGSFRHEAGRLMLDCDDRGVDFEVYQRSESVDAALRAWFEQRSQFCPGGPALGLRRATLLQIRVSHCADGGSILGVCWNHGVADWRSLMHFMKSWSSAAAGTAFEPPLMVADRHAFTAERIDDADSTPGLRLVGNRELFRRVAVLLLAEHRAMWTTFLFDDEEVAALHHSVQERASTRVSANDALLAHFLTLVAEADPSERARHLLLALDWRGKCALSDALIGNFASAVDVKFEPSLSLEERATEIRGALDRWTPNYHATDRFLAAHGGASRIYRMTPPGLDLGDSLTISNWNRFGVYDVTFGIARPVFVSPMMQTTIPWHGFILEGPENRGYQLCINLYGVAGVRMRTPEMLARLHRYRPSYRPNGVEKRLPWLL
jgi:hypothetical protein